MVTIMLIHGTQQSVPRVSYPVISPPQSFPTQQAVSHTSHHFISLLQTTSNQQADNRLVERATSHKEEETILMMLIGVAKKVMVVS